MLDILSLTINQLKDKRVFEEIEKEINDISLHQDVKRAYPLQLRLRKKIDEFPELKNSSFSTYEKYEQTIAKLKFISIARLTERELIDLVKNHFGLLLSLSINPLLELDLVQQLKKWLIYSSFIDDEALRAELDQAIRTCDFRITSEKIILLDKTNVSPSVANWIKDYNQRLYGKKDRVLGRVEYLANSPNFVKLSAEEKEKIRRLIKFYDFINTSTLIPAGYPEDIIVEWPDKMIQIVSDGEIFTVNPPFSPAAKSISPTKTTLTLGEKRKIEEKKEEPLSSLEKKYLEEEEKK